MKTVKYLGPNGKPQAKKVVKLVETDGIAYSIEEDGKLVLFLRTEAVLKLSLKDWALVDQDETVAKKRTPKPKRWRRIKYVGMDSKLKPARYFKSGVFDCGDILPNLRGLPVYWRSAAGTVTLSEAYYGMALGSEHSAQNVAARKEVLIERLGGITRDHCIRMLLTNSQGKAPLWRATAQDFFNQEEL